MAFRNLATSPREPMFQLGTTTSGKLSNVCFRRNAAISRVRSAPPLPFLITTTCAPAPKSSCLLSRSLRGASTPRRPPSLWTSSHEPCPSHASRSRTGPSFRFSSSSHLRQPHSRLATTIIQRSPRSSWTSRYNTTQNSPSSITSLRPVRHNAQRQGRIILFYFVKCE